MTKTIQCMAVSFIFALLCGGCSTTQPMVETPKEEQPKQIVCKPVLKPESVFDKQPEQLTENIVQPVPVKAEVVETPKSVAPPADVERFRPLTTIYFDFDSSTLKEDAKSELEQFYLKAKSESTRYALEGFCDEWGNDEYNIALGERRARSAQNYLKTRGVDATRLEIVSYGKEFPADQGHNRQAWRKNRRVEIIPAGSPKPSSHVRYGKEND